MHSPSTLVIPLLVTLPLSAAATTTATGHNGDERGHTGRSRSALIVDGFFSTHTTAAIITLLLLNRRRRPFGVLCPILLRSLSVDIGDSEWFCDANFANAGVTCATVLRTKIPTPP